MERRFKKKKADFEQWRNAHTGGFTQCPKPASLGPWIIHRPNKPCVDCMEEAERTDFINMLFYFMLFYQHLGKNKFQLINY